MFQTEFAQPIPVGERGTNLRDREVESHQRVERFLRDLRPGFPARYRGLSHSKEIDEITRLQSEGLSIAPDLLGREEPDLTPERVRDLIVRVIVKDHGPTILASGDMKVWH